MTPEKQNRLDGKFALVTGASKGIGRAAALELARMGASVAVNYNSSHDAAIETEKAIKDCGVDGFTVRADVGKLDAVNSMIDIVNDRFGQIDILVNNAGIIDDGLLLRMTDEAWKKVIDTNLNGTFYCTRAVIRSMVKARWGRVINIGSVVGLRGNVGQTKLYCFQGRNHWIYLRLGQGSRHQEHNGQHRDTRLRKHGDRRRLNGKTKRHDYGLDTYATIWRDR